MVSRQQIDRLCDFLVQHAHPEKVILFGSYAYGTPTDDSDVDVMLVMPCEGDCTAKAVEIWKSFDVPFAIDLMVRTPAMVRERLSLGDFFIREIMEKGRVLYDATGTGVGYQGGSGLRQCQARVSRA